MPERKPDHVLVIDVPGRYTLTGRAVLKYRPGESEASAVVDLGPKYETVSRRFAMGDGSVYQAIDWMRRVLQDHDADCLANVGDPEQAMSDPENPPYTDPKPDPSVKYGLGPVAEAVHSTAPVPDIAKYGSNPVTREDALRYPKPTVDPEAEGDAAFAPDDAPIAPSASKPETVWHQAKVTYNPQGKQFAVTFNAGRDVVYINDEEIDRLRRDATSGDNEAQTGVAGVDTEEDLQRALPGHKGAFKPGHDRWDTEDVIRLYEVGAIGKAEARLLLGLPWPPKQWGTER